MYGMDQFWWFSLTHLPTLTDTLPLTLFIQYYITYKHHVLPATSQWFLACTPSCLAPKNGLRGTSWWPPGRACCAPWMGPPEPCCASAGPMGFQWDSNGIPMGLMWPVNISRKFGKILEDGVHHFIVEIPISMVQFFMLSEHRTHSNLSVILSWPY